MAHSSWQIGCNWVRFIVSIRLFSTTHTFSMGLRSGFCDGHPSTLILLSLSHFIPNLEVSLGSLVMLKTFFWAQGLDGNIVLPIQNIDSHISHHRLFLSGTQNPSPPRAVWWLYIPFFFILVYHCVEPSSVWNGTYKDEPHVCRSTILFLMSWIISLDFLMISKKEAPCLG